MADKLLDEHIAIYTTAVMRLQRMVTNKSDDIDTAEKMVWEHHGCLLAYIAKNYTRKDFVTTAPVVDTTDKWARALEAAADVLAQYQRGDKTNLTVANALAIAAEELRK